VRIRELLEIIRQEQLLGRCQLAKIEAEMRPAARAQLQELLNDGRRSQKTLLNLPFNSRT
jgi:hypothetical protein